MNKLFVFFCTGLWHGADWTFVIWGLYHGLFLLLEGILPVKKLPRALGHVYTMLVVCAGFVIFRADTLSQGAALIGKMFTGLPSGRDTMGCTGELPVCLLPAEKPERQAARALGENPGQSGESQRLCMQHRPPCALYAEPVRGHLQSVYLLPVLESGRKCMKR